MSVFRLLKLAKGRKFPVGDRLYYRCSLCGEHILSTPSTTSGCSCGNLVIDVETRMLFEKRKGTAQLMRKIA